MKQDAPTPVLDRPAHLGYLDGIRGLAALYVLLEHVQLSGLDLINAWAPVNPTPLQRLAQFLNSSVLGYGHLAVDVFIVLSGYCLMLPVAQSRGEVQLRGGLGGFVKRRARRILPPYYAALIFALVVNSVFLSTTHSTGQITSHLLLVHNVSPAWLFGINAPFWSIAVEWQIYFVFAAILLPVWRRFGGAASLATAFLLGLAPLYLLPVGKNFDWSCPWYIGLFALGMSAAWIGLRKDSRAEKWRRLPWGSLAIAFALLTVGVFFCQRSATLGASWGNWFRMEHRNVSWPLDVAVALCVGCGLLSLSTTMGSGEGALNRKVMAVLESPSIARLGAFSYSLYLIHLPVVTLWALVLRKLSLSPAASYACMYIGGIPIGMAGGYLFYLAVERHCLGTKVSSRRIAPATLEASIAPAELLVQPAS
jgi:peptidoglycan/LPS O-acetylase OafA/YrhL